MEDLVKICFIFGDVPILKNFLLIPYQRQDINILLALRLW